MTTGISLVRENTASMQPPRSLWVSFPLGRPLGKPGDTDFQHGVIRAALNLLERPDGPVLEDYPVDVPVSIADNALACPVSFLRPEQAHDAGSWKDRLLTDLATVMPWYQMSRHRRGRTLVGVAEASPQENMAAIGQLLDDDRLPLDSLKWFKHAVEDLKVLYLEALTAQPGNHDHEQIQKIFWQESVFGAALLQFHERCQQAPDRSVALLARMIVPRQALEAGVVPADSAAQQAFPSPPEER